MELEFGSVVRRRASMVTTEISQVPLSGVLFLLQTAQQAGMPALLDVDVSPEVALGPAQLGTQAELLQCVTSASVVKLTADAARELLTLVNPSLKQQQEKSLDGLAQQLADALRTRLCVVTEGSKGLALALGRRTAREGGVGGGVKVNPVFVPGLKGISLTDFTGAGDAAFGGMVASLHAHGYPSNQEGLLRMGRVAAAAGAACVEVNGALPTPGKSAARVLQLAKEAQPLVDAAALLDMGLSPSSSASSAEAAAALAAGFKARSPVIQAYARSLEKDHRAIKALSVGLSLHEKEDKIKKVIELLAEGHTGSKKKTHIYTSGIGKSGLVAARLASSLRSISIRSSHVPATDFVHGDMGSLARGDVLVCLSSSGKTNELIDATRRVRAKGVDVIAITGNPSSPLAQLADIHIHAKSTSELLGKIPSRSIVVNEAVSNAFVSAIAEATHFTVLDFLDNHPGGSIGAAASLSLASTATFTTSSSTGVVGVPPVSATAGAAASRSSSSSSGLPKP
jgi:arabinose-5-phosphate isomerase